MGDFCQGPSAPSYPLCEGLLRDGSPCTHHAGAPREHGLAMLGTRVTFPSRGKSPKARQGLRPLESPGARFSPFSRSLTHRAGLVSATEKDRFATLRWWANRSLLFPLALTRKNILLLIRGSGAFSCTFRCNFWGDSGYR